MVIPTSCLFMVSCHAHLHIVDYSSTVFMHGMLAPHGNPTDVLAAHIKCTEAEWAARRSANSGASQDRDRAPKR